MPSVIISDHQWSPVIISDQWRIYIYIYYNIHIYIYQISQGHTSNLLPRVPQGALVTAEPAAVAPRGAAPHRRSVEDFTVVQRGISSSGIDVNDTSEGDWKRLKHTWVWVNTYRYIFSGMNIHKSQLWLGVNKRYQGFDPSPHQTWIKHMNIFTSFPKNTTCRCSHAVFPWIYCLWICQKTLVVECVYIYIYVATSHKSRGGLIWHYL